MFFKNKPIRQKLISVILLTSTFVLMLTCIAFFVYEYYSFRKSILRETTILAQMCAANSTAALAFGNAEDAAEVLATLRVNPNIEAAILFNEKDSVFAAYPNLVDTSGYKFKKTLNNFQFSQSHLQGTIPVIYDNKQLGKLYVRSDMNAIYDRFTLYSIIVLCVIIFSLLAAYLLSNILQQNISMPILNLAGIAKTIAENKDYSVRAVPFDNDEVGELTTAFNSMLSEVQKQNEEINALNENLEQKVKARTLELEVAYSEMEAFSYMASHDLNVPLRHIDSYLNLYLSNDNLNLDDEGKLLLGKVMTNAKKMRQLIEDLLAFAQLGRRELKKTTVNMKDMALSIFDEYRKLENERHINFDIDGIPDANVDYTTIKQVWSNLITNALKYSRKKESTKISISYQELPDSIVYTVKDNGVGFDMTKASKLFNPFERLHSQKDFEGTGVGLAIVNRIIAKHGGKVWAESTPSQGANFYFSIPKSQKV